MPPITFAEQEEANKLELELIDKKFRAATLNATRSLGEVKRDQAASLAVAHRDQLIASLQKVSWSQWAHGQYTLADLHRMLNLAVSLDDLAYHGKRPQFEELLKVLAELEHLMAMDAMYPPYRAMCVKTHADLVAMHENKFRDSQVNIDEMDHQAFYATVAILKRCVLGSVESLVDRCDRDQAALVAQYQAVLSKQQEEYAKESAIVDASTPARLRASRPEEDMDAWQVPKEKKQLEFSDPAAKAWYERNTRMKAIEDYDDEWYLHHRIDVSTLLPRAERVAAETSMEPFLQNVKTVQELQAIAEERLAIVERSAADNTEEERVVVGGLAEQEALLIAAGKAYQERKRLQREACEADIVRMQEFRQAQLRGSADLTAEYEHTKGEALAWLERNDADIAATMAEIQRLQEHVLQLTQSRKQVADAVLVAAEAESKRLSKQAAYLALCDEYDVLLKKSLENFLLPVGYSGVLVDFSHQCGQLATQHFEATKIATNGFLTRALTELSHVALTGSLLAAPIIKRKEDRATDLRQKAEVARKQREFCHSTSDPYKDRHDTTEQVLLNMVKQVEATIPSVRQIAADFTAKWQGAVAIVDAKYVAAAQLHPALLRRTDILNAIAVGDYSSYVTRGARPALINLDHDSLQRLSVPPVFYDALLCERAAKALVAERTFK